MKPIALIISTQRCDTAPMMKVVTATQKIDTRNVTRNSRSDSVPTPHRPCPRPPCLQAGITWRKNQQIGALMYFV